MVDDLTPQSPTDGQQPEAAGKQGFMSTTLGKVVVYGGAAIALLTVLGIAAFIALSFFVFNAAEDVLDQAASSVGSQVTTGTASADPAEQEPVEPGEIPLTSIFTFRDIFDPLIKSVPADSGSSTNETSTAGDTDGDGVPDLAPNTLYLDSIVVEDGITRAVLLYNNSEYRLAQGEVVGDTPWKVLSISSGSVTMLYGDSQVVLVVGQGVSAK